MDILDNLKDKTSGSLDKAKEKGKEAYDTGSEALSDATKSMSEKLSRAWKQNLKPKTREAIEEKIKTGIESAVDAKEVATGEKMHREVMSAMQKQEEYNDLLAAKLEEALNRIDELEQKVDELS
jgi:rhamnose utilization protein RhaD (predicted bifunctional aldolase and dehydrogenase)